MTNGKPGCGAGCSVCLRPRSTIGGMQDQVDLAFVSTFGRRGGVVVNNGDLYTIERLRPHVVFPVHHGGGEDLSQRFADEVAGSVEPTNIMVARRLGDSFSYSDGHARRVPR